MSNTPQLYKLTTSGFILDSQGRLLLLKRREDTEFLPGFWTVPAGESMTGESVESGLVRAIREATGLETNIDRLFGHFEYVDSRHQPSVSLNFLCSFNDTAPVINLGRDLVEQAWANLVDLTNYNVTPEMYEACRWALGLGSQARSK